MLRRAVFSSFLLFLTPSVFAKDLPSGAINALFEEAVSHDTVPGITMALGNDKGMLMAKGYGFADVENHVPMTTDHKVRIGSVSKLIATAGLMRLAEAGNIDLDKPVTEYVSAWPAEKPVITLRQLTSHTAGIRHYKEGANEFLLNESYPDIDSALAMFKDDPLLFAPGTDHRYSTFAWTLVSAAMEGADPSRDFRAIINEEVFAPLKLDNTVFDDQYTIIDHRARPYTVHEGELINAPQTDHSYKWAGGGFISTPSDIVRFAVAHVASDYLKPETTRAMFTPARLNNGETVGFGIGWKTGFGDYKQRKAYKDNASALALMDDIPDAVMHSGGSMGGITMTILCREHKTAVTVVKNVSGEDNADVFLLALKTLHFAHTSQ